MNRDDSSSEDEQKLYENLSKLPPANQLLPRQLTIDIDIKSLYPLKPLPTFNKVYANFTEGSSTKESTQESQADECLTLVDYYEENKLGLCYKKFDQLDLGKRVCGERLYFASILANFKKTIPKLYFRGDPLFDQKCVPVDKDQLVFDSNFESGNLFCAFRRTENVYDLILQNDINTRGNTQWFFFSIQGAKAGQTIQINILNHLKTGSLFNEGLQPAIYSMKEHEITQSEWFRGGFNISYFKSPYIKEFPLAQRRKYYQLRFSYTFKYDDDKVYFAHSYPYTYTNLLQHLNTILLDPERNQYMTRKVLCQTLGGNTCDVITITSNNLQRRSYRKGVIFMARQHPGEPQGSYIMQGIIDFLVSDNPQADFLRNNCIFKIFPMLNTDGVINGNYRCGLEGSDLNRRWKKPNKRLHPTVYYTKKYIKGFAKERSILLVMDLHGHSRKQSSFVYGCAYSAQVKAIERVFALLMSKVNPLVSYPSCTFKVESSKDKTARIQLWRELKINWVYTYECSFFGQDKKHFSIKDYLQCGNSICSALSQIVRDNSKEFTNATNVPDIQTHLLEELARMPQTDDQDVGSDSEQSENELSDDEMMSLFNPKTYNLKQKVLKQDIQKKIKPPPKPTLSQKSSLVNESPQKTEQFIKVPVKPRNPLYRITPPQRKPVQEIKSPEPSVLMVDKAVQTDEWMYRQYQIQQANKQKQQLQMTQTPNRNIYKSSSSSVTRFIVKNSSTRNQDRGRVDSMSLMASSFQNKLSKQSLILVSNSQQRQMMKYGTNFLS